MNSVMTKAALAVAIGGLASIPANAQDISAAPTYETVRLNSGFTPDPYVVYLRSGGSIPAGDLSSSCRGYIANAPDVRLHYSTTSGILPLILSVDSGADTTLVVNAPDGRWYCDDDTGEGLNPLMRFDSPLSGRYEIWVGTYGSEDLHEATLSISELDSTVSTSYSEPSRPDPLLDPTYTTLNLSGGFTPDPRTVRLRSGGNYAASEISSECRGYIATAPDVRVNYSAGSLPLILSVDSSADTTLVVNDPNGNWHCDDDSGQGLNPSLRFEKAASGQYDIWVGTYSDSSFEDATLSVSELYSE